MGNCVLLYSGGMDSLISWFYLNRPETLYVDLGHRYAEKEMRAIVNLPPKPRFLVSSYGFYFEREDAHIPGRNLILGMYAAGMGYDEIYLVAQAGERNIPDRTDEFFADTSRILTFHFGREIRFINPMHHMYKHEMVRWYLEQGYPEQYLLDSISCYSGDPGHCGQCTSCFRKYVALKANGIACEGVFSSDVRLWGKKHYIGRLDQYDEERRKVMEEVLI